MIEEDGVRNVNTILTTIPEGNTNSYRIEKKNNLFS